MPKYYTETNINTGKVDRVVIQDAGGIHNYYPDLRGWLEFSADGLYGIKLEGEDPKRVKGTDPDLLEFNRVWNRSSRGETKASEIMDASGTADRIAKAVFALGENG